MKYIFLLATLSLFYLANGQNQLSDKYDFWIGNWEVSWPEADGKTGKGTNLIEATLDGTVIQENFKITEGQSKGFKGTSVSVYNPNTKVWKQAWADNQGGYFDFTGGEDEEGDPTFITAVRMTDTSAVVQRMVFKDISESGFVWDWEGSRDGGKTWKTNWQITYKKILPETTSAALTDFAPMIGTCNCESQRMGQDGKWLDPVKSTWTFKYIMEGRGIQDEFTQVDGLSGGSIRQFNDKEKKWYVHYYSSRAASPRLQSWEGEKQKDGSILLYSPQKSSSGEGGFLKLRFYNISEKGYDWIGEWVNKDESKVSPFWKIICKKL